MEEIPVLELSLDYEKQGGYDYCLNTPKSRVNSIALMKSIALDEYSEYMKFPADLSLAKERAARHLLRDKRGGIIQGQLPFWISKESLLHYSLTYYFYFDFIKQGVEILLITFLISGIFDLITSILYPMDKNETISYTNYIFQLSTLNQKYSPTILSIKLSLAMLNMIIIKIFCIF